MGVFKEEFTYLEDLAARQVQIYPGDSVDYGVFATDEIKDMMRNLIPALPEMKVVFKSDKPYVQRTYRARIWWDSEDGVDIRIHYANDKPKKKEYFAIDLVPIRAKMFAEGKR